MRKKKTITICSSVAFYKQVLEIEKTLKKMGFKIIVPVTARRMSKVGNFDEMIWKTWYKDPSTFSVKTKLMKDHFKKVIIGDAILVLNYKKKGVDGYIGGNVLMEMTLAFHYKKPIFIFNQVYKDSPLYEEIFGVNPIFLKGDLHNIKL